ncbi:MAG: hypothetical protein Q9174_003427 [Haloplaca sp. 1 TL-2023]
MSELDHSPPQLPEIRVTHFSAGAERPVSVKSFLHSLKRRSPSWRPRAKAGPLQCPNPQSRLDPQQQYDPSEESPALMLEDEAITENLPPDPQMATHHQSSESVKGVQPRHGGTKSGKVKRTYKVKRSRLKTAAMAADPQSPKKRRRCNVTNELPLIGMVDGLHFDHITNNRQSDAPTDSIESCTQDTMTFALKRSGDNHMPKRKPLSTIKGSFNQQSTVDMDPRDFRFPPKTPRRPWPKTWRPGSGFRKQKHAKYMKIGDLANATRQSKTSGFSVKQRPSTTEGGDLRSHKGQGTPRVVGHREGSAMEERSNDISSHTPEMMDQSPTTMQTHDSFTKPDAPACSSAKSSKLFLPEVRQGSHLYKDASALQYDKSTSNQASAAKQREGFVYRRSRSTLTQGRASSFSRSTRPDQTVVMELSSTCPNGQDRSRDTKALLKDRHARDLILTMPPIRSLVSETTTEQQRTMTPSHIPPFRESN